MDALKREADGSPFFVSSVENAMTNTFLIPLPNNGIVISGAQRSGKTTMLNAYLKDVAKYSNSISPDILVICDRPAFHDLDSRFDPDIPLDKLDLVRITANQFPHVERYKTVAFAITLDPFKRAYQEPSDAYNNFVAKLNARPNPPFTVILVDTN